MHTNCEQLNTIEELQCIQSTQITHHGKAQHQIVNYSLNKYLNMNMVALDFLDVLYYKLYTCIYVDRGSISHTYVYHLVWVEQKHGHITLT